MIIGKLTTQIHMANGNITGICLYMYIHTHTQTILQLSGLCTFCRDKS